MHWVSQAHPPYPLDGFCLQWRSSVTYWTTAPVRYYPSTALVLLWSSVSCRHRSRPLPSSPGLHSGSSQRLATKNWKTEADMAENGWGWFWKKLRCGDWTRRTSDCSSERFRPAAVYLHHLSSEFHENVWYRLWKQEAQLLLWRPIVLLRHTTYGIAIDRWLE